MQRLIKKIGAVTIAAAIALVWSPAGAEAPDPLRYDVSDTVDTLVDSLAQGSKAGRQVLESLDEPTRQTLDRILTGEDFRYAGFSARTQVTALYNLAETKEPGEGNRFIAKLHKQVAPTSAAMDLDPDLQDISRAFTAKDLARDLSFADPQDLVGDDKLLKPLPENIRKAVDALADAIAPKDLGSLVQMAERNLRLSTGDKSARRVINSEIIQASNIRDTIQRLVLAHNPPPSTETATRKLMMEVAESRAVIDATFVSALNDLVEEPLPERLRNFADNADQLPSRIAQANAAPGGVGVSRARTGTEAAEFFARVFAEGGVEAIASANSGGGGGGPSYQSARSAHADYGRRTHSGPNPVSRTFSIAIRSARAARGVAVGAPVKMPGASPDQVYWLPAGDDQTFGRIAVKMPGNDRVAASRHLFADSFEAAVSTLWEDHGEDAAFRKDNITIVMSMDPESNINSSERDQIVSEAEADFVRLQSEARRAVDAGNFASLLNSLTEIEALEQEAVEKLASLPRGIVIHPALYGRELSWSVARIDFLFNDLERVSKEGALVNGGSEIPANLKEVWSGNAGTWQFYERGSEVSIAKAPGSADVLRVNSSNRDSPDDYSSTGHFSVSLFSLSETRPSIAAEQDEEGVWRLLGEQRRVQPLLDWALTNHHDFMRLNDYSEALSILRWAHARNSQLIILDPDGPAQKISTPDRVRIQDVAPQAGGEL